MSFNTLIFAAFLAIVLVGDRCLSTARSRKLFLLVASYLFYASWNPPFVLLIWISTAIDWFAAGAMGRTDSPSRRRLLVIASLVTNLGLLGYFKYGGFFLAQVEHVLAGLGVAWTPPENSIVLPVGISFYTLQTLSYTIDVYRGSTEPAESLLDFALYVTFFPQLVAGPIVRSTDFLPQCVRPKRASAGEFSWGFCLIVLGLFEKVVLADAIMAPVVDAIYNGASLGEVGTLDAWAGTVAFSSQVFCDFAGYSTCAIGVALCLGFVLPDNFRWPNGALGFSDYWRRWHISLSSWLRDYLYISLGGNRRGRVRTYTNLMATMLLGGLWHGASWHYVLWGGMHGAYLVVERFFRERFGGALAPFFEARFGRVLGMLGTYVAVTFAFVAFRANDLDDAGRVFRAMVGFGGRMVSLPIDVSVTPDQILFALVTSAVLVGVHMAGRSTHLPAVFEKLPTPARIAVVAVMAFLVLFMPGEDRAFIYFQF